MNLPYARSFWMLALAALTMTACAPAATTEPIYVVVTSTTPTTPVPTIITPLATVVTAVPSSTPTLSEIITQQPSESPAPTQPASAMCPGAPSTRMSVGITGRVTITNRLPVNVRESAGISMELVGAMPEGTEFAVVNGPVCADAMWWWNIDAATGIGGWAAEGDETGYFLEPYP